jgi:hypothetical protein
MGAIVTAARVANDLGVAAWFGGVVADGVSLPKATGAESSTPPDRQRMAAGWQAWRPVRTAAIATHLVGSAVLALDNRQRLMAQRNVFTVAVVKTLCTAGALAATVASAKAGRAVADEGAPPQRVALPGWLVPVFTAGIIATDAVLGEQQRPTHVARGVLSRLNLRR